MSTDVFTTVVRIASELSGDRAPHEANDETRLSDEGFWLTSIELLDLVLRCEADLGLDMPGRALLGREAFTSVGSLSAALSHALAGDSS